jgi:hypothetical protein
MFITVLFIIGKSWEKETNKCSSTGKWINELDYTHKMDICKSLLGSQRS